MPRETPIIRERSLPATLLQFGALLVLILFAIWATGAIHWGLFWGSAFYVVYSYTVRKILTRHQSQGIALTLTGAWAEAIPHFQASYSFFASRPSLDRYRSIALMSASAASFRELALVNIAFCEAQLGRGADARATYERTLEEFPPPRASPGMDMTAVLRRGAENAA